MFTGFEVIVLLSFPYGLLFDWIGNYGWYKLSVISGKTVIKLVAYSLSHGAA